MSRDVHMHDQFVHAQRCSACGAMLFIGACAQKTCARFDASLVERPNDYASLSPWRYGLWPAGGASIDL